MPGRVSIKRKPLYRAAAACLAVPLALVIAELSMFAVLPRLDREALYPHLYLLDLEMEVHEPDPDPQVVIRLTPGSSGTYPGPYGSFDVHINSLGLRGPEVAATCPEGVFRILCMGGSNVYGGGISDHQTWPALLEVELDRRGPGRFEVLNGGVASFNSLQMVAMSRRHLDTLEPDLLIFAPSNPTPRSFLAGTPDVRRYFREDPSLWDEILPAGYGAGDAVPPALRSLLLRHSRLARVLMCRSFDGRRATGPMGYFRAVDLPEYQRATREFLAEAAADTRVAFFVGPFVPAMQAGYRFEDHRTGVDLPVLELEATGKPGVFLDSHPPESVLRWYAEEIADWLAAEGLLPTVKGD